MTNKDMQMQSVPDGKKCKNKNTTEPDLFKLQTHGEVEEEIKKEPQEEIFVIDVSEPDSVLEETVPVVNTPDEESKRNTIEEQSLNDKIITDKMKKEKSENFR